MSEFILVKNADDSGSALLRIEYILAVQDYGDKGTYVDYGDCSEHSTRIRVASTASEVLAAIQEAQGVVPRHVEGGLAVDMGTGQYASRFYFTRSADTSQANGEKVTRNTILAGPITERFVTSAERAVFVCICPHHQGDNPACPVHGEGTAWGDLHGD